MDFEWSVNDCQLVRNLDCQVLRKADSHNLSCSCGEENLIDAFVTSQMPLWTFHDWLTWLYVSSREQAIIASFHDSHSTLSEFLFDDSNL